MRIAPRGTGLDQIARTRAVTVEHEQGLVRFKPLNIRIHPDIM